MRLALVCLVCGVCCTAEAQSTDDAAGFGDLPPAITEAPAEAPVSEADAAGFGDLPPANADASDNASADDDVGFGDLPGPAETVETDGPSPLSFDGFLRAQVGVAPERSIDRALVLARVTLEAHARLQTGPLRVVLGVHGEMDPSYLLAGSDVDAPTRRLYRGVVMPWEAFAELRSTAVTFAFGRQIVAWGNSQLVPLLDLVNPRDMRMPGLGSPGDQRLPITMTRLAVDHGAHRFEALVLHEVDYRFLPPPMSFYSPLPAILRAGSGVTQSGFLQIAEDYDITYRHTPGRVSRGSQQALARYRYIGPVVEVGVYGGFAAHPEGAFSLPGLADFADDELEFDVEHPRYGLAGASVLGTRGDFTFFADGLVEMSRPVTVGDLDALPFYVERADQTWAKYVVGVRYAGIDQGFIALEHGFGFEVDPVQGAPSPILPVAPPSLAGVYQQRLAREQVELEIAASAFGPRLRGGGIARATLTYKPRDGVRLSLAYVLFVPGLAPSPIAGFERHDRIDFTLRWDFATPS